MRTNISTFVFENVGVTKLVTSLFIKGTLVFSQIESFSMDVRAEGCTGESGVGSLIAQLNPEAVGVLPRHLFLPDFYTKRKKFLCVTPIGSRGLSALEGVPPPTEPLLYYPVLSFFNRRLRNLNKK